MVKLEQSGIVARVEKLRKNHDLPVQGFTDSYDVVDQVKELKKEGYYQHMPQDEKKLYFENLNNLFQQTNRDKAVGWRVTRKNGEVDENIEIQDFPVISRWMASYVLKPKAFSKTFGFATVTEMIETVGAYVYQQSQSENLFHPWKSTLADGRKMITQVTGDIHCDLRIFQTDVTQYPVIDMFGNNLSMRPLGRKDELYAAPYHSNEPALFASILQYLKQEKVHSVVLTDLSKLVSWLNSLGSGEITCAEHFGRGDEFSAGQALHLVTKLPRINKKLRAPTHSSNILTTQNEKYHYFCYVDVNSAFAICGEDTNKRTLVKKPSIIVPKENIDDFIKGLFAQAKLHRGRTPVETLLFMVESYR
jgi:hypothetical protein